MTASLAHVKLALACFGFLIILSVYLLLFTILHLTHPLGGPTPVNLWNRSLAGGHFSGKLMMSKDVEIKELKERYHLTPYDPQLPTNYSPSKWHHNSRYKGAMGKYLLQKFRGKRGGFFVECGAFDGFFISNTVELEKRYNWSGLLIEADPDVFPELKSRNRRAWVTDVCLSPKPYPMKVNMTGAKKTMGHGFIQNGVIENERQDKGLYTRRFQVKCYPLATLLGAIGRRKVDYFSLDVEGVELDILKTIPWNNFDIKLISVEIRDSNRERIREFLESVGYRMVREVRESSDYIHDHIYEKVEPKPSRSMGKGRT